MESGRRLHSRFDERALAVGTMQQRTHIEDRAVALPGRGSMRGLARGLVAAIIVAFCSWGLARAAAPAPPSYLAIERTIETIRKAWSSSGGEANPLASGWSALFDTLLRELKAYGAAENEAARVAALDTLQQISLSLGTAEWPPAAELNQELKQWLEPRLRLAWAGRRLNDTIAALPPTSDVAVQANRNRWLEFAHDDLGHASRISTRRRPLRSARAHCIAFTSRCAFCRRRTASGPRRPPTSWRRP